MGAGTCEFLIGLDGTISFLEVNTRLQVEHPVSEEITGIDLVREQFRLAEGGSLDYPDPEPRGHSFEFRINGEDPGSNFFPTPGPIHSLRFPGGPGVRVDSGVTTGDVISGAFDSLLAKLIVTGANRQDALEKSRRALMEFEVTGLPTVIPFHRKIVNHPSFAGPGENEFSIFTTWIEEEFENDIDPWAGSVPDSLEEDEPYRTVVVEVEGRRLKVGVPAQIFAGGSSMSLGRPPKRATLSGSDSSPGTNSVSSPMQATITKVSVTNGERVVQGDVVCVLEAMKMEQPITAPKTGVVRNLTVVVGDSVASKEVLFEIEDS